MIANHNSPKQSVISGSTEAIGKAIEQLAAAKITARKIPVACAFHSPIVAGARDALGARLAGLEIAAPQVPVWSNTTAMPYPTEPDAIRALLAEQVAKPVRFAHEIAAMYDAGARVFVETGPGQVLTRLVAEILGDRPHVAIACDAGDAGIRQFLRALAALAACDATVDTDPLFWDRDAAIIELDTKPARVKPWLVNGHRTRPVNGEAPMPVRPTPLVVAPVAAAPAERDTVVIEYLRNMRSMITAQRDVMLGYLGTVPAPMREMIEVPVQRVIDVVPAPMPAQVAAAPAKPVVTDPMQLVISIVSERTGYPVETLGIDLDLEADLSIDSIKRIEIIGELAQRLGLRVDGTGGADAIVEELATRKTLRSLVAWLVQRLGTDAPKAVPSEVEELVTKPIAVDAQRVRRYRLDVVDAPAPVNGSSTFAGKTFAIYDGNAIGAALAARLTEEGAIVRRIDHGDAVGEVDGFVDLGVVDGVTTMREMFERVRAAAVGGAKLIYVATMGGQLGRGGYGGPAGLIKTVAAEWPDVRARLVDLDSTDDAAAMIHRELHADDHHVEIGYVGGVRSSLEVVPAEISAIEHIDLDADSVVLITGGARGITAKVAVALARRYGCRIELVGRSPLPEAEDPTLAGAADARALRGSPRIAASPRSHRE